MTPPVTPPDVTAGLRHVKVLDDLFRKLCDDRRVWSGIIRDAVKDTPHHARAIAAFEVVNTQVDALAAAVAALQSPADPSAAPSGRLMAQASYADELSAAEEAVFAALTDEQKLAVGHAIRLCSIAVRREHVAADPSAVTAGLRERLLKEAVAFEGFIEQSRSDTLVTWVDQGEQYRLIAGLLREAAAAFQGEGPQELRESAEAVRAARDRIDLRENDIPKQQCILRLSINELGHLNRLLQLGLSGRPRCDTAGVWRYDDVRGHTDG